MIGLGRMGTGMTRRLLRVGHDCVVYDRDPEAVRALAEDGATGVASPAALVAALRPPRAIWMMVPAAAVDGALDELAPLVAPDDALIDGGNSHHVDDLRRAAALSARGVHYLDVGTSGGVWGLERGYCLMIGGEPEVVLRLEPLFAALAPGEQAAPPTPGRDPDAGRGASSPTTAQRGYLHCGPPGAGHFVKMVHNGIEYGLMAAYAEGLNVLRGASIGRADAAPDAETAPLRDPAHYRYQLDVAEITELWRRGSVVGSWLLDLTAAALAGDPGLEAYDGHVSDSGEGRWTVQAAVDEGVPVPVLSAALFARFSSRGRSDFGDRVLSAMRHAVGGHLERRP
jgi:6-phosphogluconate dehydrogenase